MKKELLHDKKIFSQIQKNIANKKWCCLCNNCSAIAINSHLLQRNGILNILAEQNHLYEIRPKSYFEWDEITLPIIFNRVGINQALSNDIFCNNHDTSLFNDIESGNVDYSQYKTGLLLSYRAVCCEIRKKEKNIEFWNRILKAKSLSVHYSAMASRSIAGNQIGIDDLTEYKKLIELDLSGQINENFVFICYEYPLLKLYASSTMSYDDNCDINHDKIWDGAFFHLIPTPIHSYIILGYHKKHSNTHLEQYVQSWRDLSAEELGYKLTEIFATRVESWGMSPSLYRELSKNNIQKFLEYFGEHALDYGINQKVDFNLFEGVF